MEQAKLIARKDNMEFFFIPVRNERELVEIEMYSTNYVLVKKGNGWVNSESNKCTMSPELVKAVITTVGMD